MMGSPCGAAGRTCTGRTCTHNWREIRDLLAEYRMEVCHVVPAQFRYPSLLASSNEKVRRDSVRYIMDNADNALLLGAPSVHVCAGFSLFDEPLERGWECLRRSIIEILEYMRGTGLRLYIEPAHRFESNQILTLDDGLRMVREIGDAQLGILLDTGHLHVNGEDLAEGVAKLGPLLGHVDLDDNDGSADAHLTPGAGSIDFTPFIAELKRAGYSGYVAAELGMQYVLDPEPIAAASLAWMRKAFADRE